jgi:uncharacterized membrane protein (DUF485 family)
MGGHGPAADWGVDNASDYKAKLGVYMFIVYVLIYIGFIVINVVSPKLMGVILFAGLNMAMVYGVGLIILAIIMGLIYNYLCTKKEDELNK